MFSLETWTAAQYKLSRLEILLGLESNNEVFCRKVFSRLE